MTTLLERAKMTAGIRLFGFLKIPMVFFVRPSLLETSHERVVIKIPLIRRNKNHLNSMYFGVLASGADLTAGFLVMSAIQRSGVKVNMVFKSFNAEFKKRVEGDAHFECEQGKEITDLVAKAIASGEREEMPLTVSVKVPGKLDEPAAIFTMMLSLKKK